MAAMSPENITSSVMKFSCTERAIVLPILNSPITYLETKKAAEVENSGPKNRLEGS